MAPVRKKELRRPIGMFIYCTKEEKARIKRAAKAARRSLTDYAMVAIMRQLDADEVLKKEPRNG